MTIFQEYFNREFKRNLPERFLSDYKLETFGELCSGNFHLVLIKNNKLVMFSVFFDYWEVSEKSCFKVIDGMIEYLKLIFNQPQFFSFKKDFLQSQNKNCSSIYLYGEDLNYISEQELLLLFVIAPKNESLHVNTNVLEKLKEFKKVYESYSPEEKELVLLAGEYWNFDPFFGACFNNLDICGTLPIDSKIFNDYYLKILNFYLFAPKNIKFKDYEITKEQNFNYWLELLQGEEKEEDCGAREKIENIIYLPPYDESFDSYITELTIDEFSTFINFYKNERDHYSPERNKLFIEYYKKHKHVIGSIDPITLEKINPLIVQLKTFMNKEDVKKTKEDLLEVKENNLCLTSLVFLHEIINNPNLVFKVRDYFARKMNISLDDKKTLFSVIGHVVHKFILEVVFDDYLEYNTEGRETIILYLSLKNNDALEAYFFYSDYNEQVKTITDHNVSHWREPNWEKFINSYDDFKEMPFSWWYPIVSEVPQNNKLRL